MTLADAAEQVLVRASRPMSSKEIAEAAIADGLISPKSNQPWVYVAAAIRKDNRKRAKAGGQARFLVLPEGRFSIKQ